jgi:CrcB protein
LILVVPSIRWGLEATSILSLARDPALRLALNHAIPARMSTTLLIGVGGAFGAMARYLLSILITQAMGTQFPWGILCVNIAGCLAMGLIAGLGAQMIHMSDELKLFLATGVIGGFTTFSAFSLDAVRLVERGAYMDAAVYTLVSVAGSIAALHTGMMLVRGVAA